MVSTVKKMKKSDVKIYLIFFGDISSSSLLETGYISVWPGSTGSEQCEQCDHSSWDSFSVDMVQCVWLPQWRES